jgi:flagellar protein FliO/FliZ
VIPFVFAQADPIGIPGPDLMPPLWQTVGALAVVLGLLAVLAWVLRRSTLARRTAGSMTVESALPLGERRSLAIVSVEGRRLLVGLAPGQVSLVTELKPAASFGDAVARAMDQGATS